MSEIISSASEHDLESESAQYRSVSVAAIFALVLGLFAWLAMISPLLWMVPLVGAALSVWALRGIAGSDGALTGRGLALAGLALSLFFGAAAPAATVSDHYWLRSEARPVAEHWFQLLRDDQPHQAHQLTLNPGLRQLEGSDLWSFYRNSPDDYEALQRFTNEPLVHALLKLGPQAQVRYFGTQRYLHYEGKQQVAQYYAITYPQDGDEHTFFARVALERSLNPKTGAVQWRVVSYESGVNPYAWDRER